MIYDDKDYIETEITSVPLFLYWETYYKKNAISYLKINIDYDVTRTYGE